MYGKIMEFEKKLNNHGKIMEFSEIIWRNHQWPENYLSDASFLATVGFKF